MKLLADAHISRAMVNYLLGLGRDILHVAVMSPRMSDSNILKLAASEGRVVLTADKDFGELCFLRLIPCVGVVLLRLNAPTETSRLEIFKRYWPVIEKNVEGFFMVVTDKSVRRSQLPTAEEQQ
jgi:predicted nuclease of predicted toxin-antitoxin system